MESTRIILCIFVLRLYALYVRILGKVPYTTYIVLVAMLFVNMYTYISNGEERSEAYRKLTYYYYKKSYNTYVVRGVPLSANACAASNTQQ